jgi:hypothetical protein
MLHHEPLGGETAAEIRGQPRLVLDEQYAHGAASLRDQCAVPVKRRPTGLPAEGFTSTGYQSTLPQGHDRSEDSDT